MKIRGAIVVGHLDPRGVYQIRIATDVEEEKEEKYSHLYL